MWENINCGDLINCGRLSSLLWVVLNAISLLLQGRVPGVVLEEDPQASLHNVYFEQYVFLPSEQAETYPKICALIYHLTYICPILFS